MMSANLLPNSLVMAAFIGLIPSILIQLRSQSNLFWSFAFSVLGAFGLLPYAIMLFAEGWRVDLASTLYATLCVGWVANLILISVSRQIRVMALITQSYWLLYFILMLPLLILQDKGEVFAGNMHVGLMLHIGFALLVYVCLTQSAVIGVALAVKEYGVRTGQYMGIWNRVPPLVEGETLQRHLMIVAFILLVTDILIGVTISYLERGQFFVFDHKEVFSIGTLGGISFLIVLQHKTGIRGRRLMRWITVIFLIATLGFPGVKLVEQLL